MAPKPPLSFTSIPGLRVGHAQDEQAMTGCTVILCPEGTVGGVDQRGGAPGTRETDALHLLHLVQTVHAVVLAGGSAFGLDAAGGVVRYLEERGVGFDVRVAKVPIVPAAILFDLGIGRADVRPDAAMGYQACLNATDTPPAQGNVGAGMGATVGKILGMGQGMKGGLGCAALPAGGGVIVAAMAAVNVFGDVIDPHSGRIIAGARSPSQGADGTGLDFADTLQVMKAQAGRRYLRFATRETATSEASDQGPEARDNAAAGTSTVIGVVATNARLTKEQVNKVAQMAHDGLARAVRPAHTMLDGDTIFALATGLRKADVNLVGAFAAEAFAQAIVNAVLAARPAAGLPAAGEGNQELGITD